jgi:ubiquinol-cytochrome c reductase iron-sulfur subunit
MASDTELDDSQLDDPQRRDFLEATTAVVGAVGVAGACYPFISSMNPSRDVQAKATTRVDLASIPPGKMHTVAWQGKPVFVVHRTPEMISKMENTATTRDPQADSARVKEPQWLVVVGICTHLGCVPNRTPEGWTCPCHGSKYDNSGRVVRGPAPRNLVVPKYTFIDENHIIIGKA